MHYLYLIFESLKRVASFTELLPFRFAIHHSVDVAVAVEDVLFFGGLGVPGVLAEADVPSGVVHQVLDN